MTHPNLNVLLGPPGCGKTTGLLDVMQRELEAGVSPRKLAFLAFTKKSAQDAKDRARERFKFGDEDLLYFRTIHSLAFRQLALRPASVMQRQHYKDLGEALGMALGASGLALDGDCYGMSTGDRVVFLEGLARVKQCPLREVWEDADEADIEYAELDRYSRALAAFKANRGLLDYTDMLEEFVRKAWATVPSLDVLIVDESQDLSRTQWAVIEAIAAKAKRVYMAGDDDQCSVDGTQVLTTVGPVSVEALDPAMHRLVCYDRNGAALVGFKQGFAFKIQRTEHHGPIITVRAAEKETSTTINHKWIVRWTQEAKKSGVCVTYLMRRGTRWRVGWCQLFRADGCCHLGVRVRNEKADEAWVLGVHRSRTAASVQESVIAATFGIPTVTFEPVMGANHLTAEAIDAVFAGVGELGEKAYSCLYRFNRHPRFPIWSATEARTRRAGSQIFEARASNLLDGLMEVPVQATGNAVTWETAHIERSVRKCVVHGLDVEHHQNYVADGIVTHNCIFRWAGADVDAFMGLQGNVRVLDQSYRIPATVHGLAAQIARRMAKRTPKAWKPRAERGAIRWYADADEVDMSTGTWLLLARNGYMLADLEDMCQRQGLSFSSVSRNPLASAELKAVIIWEQMRRGQSVSKDDAFAVLRFISQRHIRHEQRIALRKTGADVQVNLTKGTDSPPWFDALDKMSEEYVEFFRAARKRGETLTGTPRIRISTIHTAKGLESDHVLLLTDMSQRTYQEMERKPDSEHRVWYVAVTRARQGLHLIQAKTQYSFDL